MHSPGINGEGELRWQPANPGSPGKMAVKTECVCVCVCVVCLCFDIASWGTRWAPVCKKLGYWFVGGDYLTGALHDLERQLSPKNRLIQVHLEKWPLKWRESTC